MEPRGYIYVMTFSAMMMGACKKPYARVVVRNDHCDCALGGTNVKPAFWKNYGE